MFCRVQSQLPRQRFFAVPYRMVNSLSSVLHAAPHEIHRLNTELFSGEATLVAAYIVACARLVLRNAVPCTVQQLSAGLSVHIG
jgi:hypothetical protein